MEYIIQQIALDLAKKITKKWINDGITDLDMFASDVTEDCKQSAVAIVEAILEHMNKQIREDKETRKNLGLAIKEKDRKREILTTLGQVHYKRDYYQSKYDKSYVYLLDSAIGVRGYERIGDTVSAELLNMASEVSYAQSSELVTKGKVTRQSVRNHILKLEVPESRPKEIKKEVSALHIFADEDHVHMQKPSKKRGKKNRIVPLVTVTEGIEKESKGRNKTINAKHFTDEKFDTDNLWKSVEGYIGMAYDIEKEMVIYIHGDGGRWISNGLESFANVKRVMDGYHIGKRLYAFSKEFGRKAKLKIEKAIKEKDRNSVDNTLQELLSDETDKDRIEKIKAFGTHLNLNWESITNRYEDKMTGSCTEPQVSHVLSKRFSRNPMGWSEAALGKLTGIRVYLKNGDKIKAEHIKPKKRVAKYREYADKIVKEVMKEGLDWSVFDVQAPVFNTGSGTQIRIHGFGRINNTLIN